MEIRSQQVHLQTLLEDFQRITQIDIVCLAMLPGHDGAAPLRFSAASENAAGLLSGLRRNPEAKERMAHLEHEAVKHIRTNQQAHCRYHPVPGLTAYAFPVSSRGMLIGCLLLGPVRESPGPDHYDRKKFDSFCRLHGLDAEALTALYDRLPLCGEAAILASSRLLSQIVVYASSIDSPAMQLPPLAERIAGYIDAQYMNPISPAAACEHFHISRTTLSRTLSREYGETFLSMLSRRRIHSVCAQLESGASPAAAAALSGFSSPTYMARVFRSVMGCTPHAYCRVNAVSQSPSGKEEDTHDHDRT